MIQLMVIANIVTSLIHITTISTLIFACGAKKKGNSNDAKTLNNNNGANAVSPAAKAPSAAPAPAEQKDQQKDAQPAENKGVEEKKSEKGKANQDKPKEGDAGGGGGGEEDEGGYESCPDMTPEQLAKIANQAGN